jgi:hypothetical protein
MELDVLETGVDDADGTLVIDVEPVMDVEAVEVLVSDLLAEGVEVVDGLSEEVSDGDIVDDSDGDVVADSLATGLSDGLLVEVLDGDKDLLSVGDFVMDGVSVTESEILTVIVGLADDDKDALNDADHDGEFVDDNDDPLDGVMLMLRLIVGVMEMDLVFDDDIVGVLDPDTEIVGVVVVEAVVNARKHKQALPSNAHTTLTQALFKDSPVSKQSNRRQQTTLPH